MKINSTLTVGNVITIALVVLSIAIQIGWSQKDIEFFGMHTTKNEIRINDLEDTVHELGWQYKELEKTMAVQNVMLKSIADKLGVTHTEVLN